MGIQGLIPFLEKASSSVSLEDIKGYTVAIDSYCWLHKGAFGCADQLSRGEDTDKYIQYCLKYVTLLLSFNIKPILVFDGRHLPAKAQTEKRRRETRDHAKKRAAELLRLGKTEEARSQMRRCIDITHEMAHRLIVECRRRNVDCIVAPYEADAQLAYLNKHNIAHYVITEDSDLVLFGCNKVIFKLDLTAKGLLVDAEKLYLAMGCRKDKYTFDKFRQMCILSGCDYLDSLPGIGLAKACKFFCRTEETDMRRALLKVPAYLNIRSITVTEEYIENFLKAEATFKFMFVFDPFKRKMVRLTELPENFDLALCSNAGTLLEQKVALQLALGNLNPFTLKKLDDWDPDRGYKNESKVQSNSWSNPAKAKHKSIWQSNFVVHQPGSNNENLKETVCAIEFKRIALKMKSTEDDNCDEQPKSESEIMSMYAAYEEPPVKRQCTDFEPAKPTKALPQTPTKTRNPFLKTTVEINSPTRLDGTTNSLLKTLSPRKNPKENKSRSLLPKLSNFNRTVINTEQKVVSRFFKSNKSIITKTEESTESSEDQESSGSPEESTDIALKVAKIMECEERQQQEATVLYLSSPEATLSDRGDKTPPRGGGTIESVGIGSLQATDSGIEISSNEKEEELAHRPDIPKELLEKFEFKVKNLNVLKQDDDIVIVSDEEQVKTVEWSQKAASNSEKPKPTVRRIGLSKTKTKKVDSSQSKLSKYFFQKRPSLK